MRPLPEAEVDRAEQRARATCRGWCVPQGSVIGDLTRQAEIVARSIDCSVDDLLALLTPDELTALYATWEEVQDAALPDAGRLSEALRRRVIRDPLIRLDGESAYMAGGVADYFGAPVASLLPGQVIYFAALRAAFHEMVVDQKVRNVSVEWLNRAD